MIVSFIAYSLVVGALAAAAAWSAERALARLGFSRRGVWLAAIAATCVLPPFAMLTQEPVRRDANLRIASAPVALMSTQEAAASLRDSPLRDARFSGIDLDAIAAILWVVASAGAIAFHAIGAWRLRRRARHWMPARVAAQAVSIAPDIGPALYGWWRPRIVFPAWLIEAPLATQRFALSHEQVHLSRHDPQLLAAGTLVAVTLPWNAPLLWMLRRLRFAMEVDCDARVLRAGADPTDYGLALIFVSERQRRSPPGTLALIERASQLERRIRIMIDSPRHRALLAAAFFALAGACVLAATQVAPPARLDDTPLKLPPSGAASMRVGQAVELLARAEYPDLLEGRFHGAPVLVVLMNEDFSVARSARIEKRDAKELVGAEDFGVIGLVTSDVPYVGATYMALPDKPGKGFNVVYTEPNAKPSEKFVSKLFPDTRAVDRKIFEHNFDAQTRRAIPAGQSPWMLLDRGGKVLRSGMEPMNDDRGFIAVLTARYPGITAQEMTVTPVTDASGKPIADLGGNDVNLVSVWLASDSPAPR
jgi:beta-lactamase regulating signal transducer with metallopeptidase domain